MNKWIYIIGSLVVIVLAIVFWPSDQSGKKDPGSKSGAHKSESGTYENFYSDAPSPIASHEDKELIRKLWPDVFEPKENNREAVKKHWREFAKKYPENIFIPQAVLPELSEEEAKARRDTLDAYTAVAAKFAAMESAAKKVKPGEEPTAASMEGITPEQQKLYFEYKIKETQSKIDLIQYALDANGLDNDQKEEANKQIAEWTKELEQYKKMAN